MKNKRKILATLISAMVISATAQASKDLSFLDDKIKINENVSVKSGDSKSPVVVNSSSNEKLKLSKFEAYIDPDKAVERSKEISTKKHELEVSKLAMEDAQLKEEIAAIEAKANQRTIESAIAEKEAEWEIEKQKIRDEYKSEKNALKFEVQLLNKKLNNAEETDLMLNKRLFVTKIYGVGNNLKAEFYFENNVKLLSNGEEIIRGAVAKRIEANGVLVSYRGKESFISLTTPSHAHMRTFGVKEDEVNPNPMPMQFMPPAPSQDYFQ